MCSHEEKRAASRCSQPWREGACQSPEDCVPGVAAMRSPYPLRGVASHTFTRQEGNARGIGERYPNVARPVFDHLNTLSPSTNTLKHKHIITHGRRLPAGGAIPAGPSLWLPRVRAGPRSHPWSQAYVHASAHSRSITGLRTASTIASHSGCLPGSHHIIAPSFGQDLGRSDASVNSGNSVFSGG